MLKVTLLYRLQGICFGTVHPVKFSLNIVLSNTLYPEINSYQMSNHFIFNPLHSNGFNIVKIYGIKTTNFIASSIPEDNAVNHNAKTLRQDRKRRVRSQNKNNPQDCIKQ